MAGTEMKEIPAYTKDDFLKTDKPYVFLDSFRGNPFQMQQMFMQLRDYAQSLGIKSIKQLWDTYQASASGETAIIDANESRFDSFPLRRQLVTGKYYCDERGVTVADGYFERVVCPHPIAPIRRFKNVDTREELLEIWFRRGSAESGYNDETITIPKDTIANGILGLAKYGIVVTAKSAKDLSAYLLDVEQYNYDWLEERKSVKRLGWIGDGCHTFSPYVEDVYFDGEEDFGGVFATVRSCGEFDKWLDIVRKVRAEKTPARIYLAAAFASVILKPCGLLPFMVHAFGGSENGKAQPLDTKIITPDGYKLMGDIKVGDKVIGGDGKPHNVIGVYPQGIKDVYRITFGDGTSTRCCKEHLWNVTTRKRRDTHKGYITMSIEEILKRPIKGKKGYEYRIPVCGPVEYESRSELPIDPYALGALIGDGCLTMKKYSANGTTNVYFSNMEDDVIQRVETGLSKIAVHLKRNVYTQCEYVLSGSGLKRLKEMIRTLGLNVKSTERFIPEQYLMASVEERKRLLAGLMDTDGFVGHEKHRVVYDTKSEKLAEDVLILCRSLGYRAKVSKNNRDEFRVQIVTDEDIFMSDKHRSHKDLLVRTRKEDKKSMAIVSVEHIGRDECQCIMLDSDEHTYLCDDFIVTHNTVALMLAASVWANPEPGEYVGTYNGTRYAQETTAGFLNSLPMCIDELQIQTSQGAKDFDDIIYQLCEGVSKKQGTASGGLRRQQKWRCTILSNGEHTILKPQSGGGARNRVIEIEAPAKMYSDLVGLCEVINHNYGFAGKRFVEWLLVDENMDRMKQLQKDYYHELQQMDVTDKQAGSASALLTADHIATEIIFQDGNALTAEDLRSVLLTRAELDVNQQTVEWLQEFISINSMHFYITDPEGDEDAKRAFQKTELWGEIDDEDNAVYIIRAVFNRIMKEHGHDARSFLAWAKRKEILKVSSGHLDVLKRIAVTNRPIRCVCIRFEEESGYNPESVDMSGIEAVSELPF